LRKSNIQTSASNPNSNANSPERKSFVAGKGDGSNGTFLSAEEAASSAVAALGGERERGSTVASLPPPSAQVNQNPEQVAAVIKLQKVQRGLLGRKESSHLLEIKNLSSKSFKPDDFSKPDPTPEENDLKEAFNKNSTNEELNSSQFVQWMKTSKVINTKFTVNDADILFQKAKKKATLTEDPTLAGGVIHGKRITYDVFRAIVIKDVSLRVNMSENGLVKYLSSSGTPNTNKSEPSKLVVETTAPVQRKSIAEMTDLGGLDLTGPGSVTKALAEAAASATQRKSYADMTDLGGLDLTGSGSVAAENTNS